MQIIIHLPTFYAFLSLMFVMVIDCVENSFHSAGLFVSPGADTDQKDEINCMHVLPILCLKYIGISNLYYLNHLVMDLMILYRIKTKHAMEAVCSIGMFCSASFAR